MKRKIGKDCACDVLPEISWQTDRHTHTQTCSSQYFATAPVGKLINNKFHKTSYPKNNDFQIKHTVVYFAQTISKLTKCCTVCLCQLFSLLKIVTPENFNKESRVQMLCLVTMSQNNASLVPQIHVHQQMMTL